MPLQLQPRGTRRSATGLPRQAKQGCNTRTLPPRDSAEMLCRTRAHDVDTIIRQIPAGQLITQSQLRMRIACDAESKQTCSLATKIVLRMTAETAEEHLCAGKSEITPYWRVIGDDGLLNDKCPGGATAQAARLHAEGHEIETLPDGRMRVSANWGLT